MKILLSLIALVILFSTASLSFATSDTAPSVPLNVNYTIVDNAIVLTWDKPLEGNPINHYQVAYQYYKHDVNPKHIENITDTYVIIDNLEHDGQYIITVTAYNDLGNAKTDELNVTIPAKSDADYDEDLTCNNHDNRDKDKCMMIENEVEDYRLDTLEKKNVELEEQLTEYETMMYEMEDKIKYNSREYSFSSINNVYLYPNEETAEHIFHTKSSQKVTNMKSGIHILNQITNYIGSLGSIQTSSQIVPDYIKSVDVYWTQHIDKNELPEYNLICEYVAGDLFNEYNGCRTPAYLNGQYHTILFKIVVEYDSEKLPENLEYVLINIVSYTELQ